MSVFNSGVEEMYAQTPYHIKVLIDFLQLNLNVCTKSVITL